MFKCLWKNCIFLAVHTSSLVKTFSSTTIISTNNCRLKSNKHEPIANNKHLSLKAGPNQFYQPPLTITIPIRDRICLEFVIPFQPSLSLEPSNEMSPPLPPWFYCHHFLHNSHHCQCYSRQQKNIQPAVPFIVTPVQLDQ